MIVTSDPISSSPSYGRMATLAPNARSGETPQALTADSVAPELTSTQIAAAVDKSATDNKQQAQQQAQNQAALHQQAAQPQAAQQQQAAAPAPVTTAEASKFLTYANQWFAQHASALNATASYNQTSALKTSSPQPTNALPNEDAPASSSPQVVSPQEQKSATTSVLKSLIYGVPLSGDAKRLISGPDSFIGLNGLSADLQKLAQENSNYVFDTPLGKMTQRDLQSLSQRIFAFVHNPSAASRNLVLGALQDIQGRQHEMQAQAMGKGPFAQIMTEIRENADKPKDESATGAQHEVRYQTPQDQKEQTSSAANISAEEYSQEQVSAAYSHESKSPADEAAARKLDLETQIKRLQNPDHEEDQKFLSNFTASHELLRDEASTATTATTTPA